MSSSTSDGVVVVKWEAEARAWRSRALASWVVLAVLAFVTCANYSSTDDLVARRQLSVGESGARVHVQGGVITLYGADGRKAVLTADGMVLLDAVGKETGRAPVGK